MRRSRRLKKLKVRFWLALPGIPGIWHRRQMADAMALMTARLQEKWEDEGRKRDRRNERRRQKAIRKMLGRKG